MQAIVTVNQPAQKWPPGGPSLPGAFRNTVTHRFCELSVSSDHGTKFSNCGYRVSCSRKDISMLAQISLAAMAGLLLPVSTAQTEAPQAYVELIVKACPSMQPDASANKPDAVQGYYTEPIIRV